MPDPAEDVPTDGPGGQSDRRLHLGALGLGVPWAIRIGAVIELADEFDWAFKGVEMAIAMIADMHHVPQEAQSRSSTSSSQSLKSVSAGQRWGIVSTSVSFQWVSMSYYVGTQVAQLIVPMG